MALVKNRYIHRTFIQPEQHSRDLGVKMKLTALPEVLGGKRVIVMDDSIVRGTTSRQIVKMLFEAGAKEVHFLVSSPPVPLSRFLQHRHSAPGCFDRLEEIRRGSAQLPGSHVPALSFF